MSRRSTAPPPAEPVRVGLVGLGAIAASHHLPELLRAPGADLVAVADPDPGGARPGAEARRPGGLRRSRRAPGPRRRRGGGHLRAVRPPRRPGRRGGRGRQARLPREAGGDRRPGRRGAWQRRWRRAGVIAAVGFNRRLHPLYEQARGIVARGRIGRVRAVQSAFCEPVGPEAMPEWKRRRATGGGVLLDLASHHVDLARWLLRDEVESASARCASELSEQDTAWLSLGMRGGARVEGVYSFRGGVRRLPGADRRARDAARGPPPPRPGPAPSPPPGVRAAPRPPGAHPGRRHVAGPAAGRAGRGAVVRPLRRGVPGPGARRGRAGRLAGRWPAQPRGRAGRGGLGVRVLLITDWLRAHGGVEAYVGDAARRARGRAGTTCALLTSTRGLGRRRIGRVPRLRHRPGRRPGRAPGRQPVRGRHGAPRPARVPPGRRVRRHVRAAPLPRRPDRPARRADRPERPRLQADLPARLEAAPGPDDLRAPARRRVLARRVPRVGPLAARPAPLRAASGRGRPGRPGAHHQPLDGARAGARGHPRPEPDAAGAAARARVPAGPRAGPAHRLLRPAELGEGRRPAAARLRPRRGRRRRPRGCG